MHDVQDRLFPACTLVTGTAHLCCGAVEQGCLQPLHKVRQLFAPLVLAPWFPLLKQCETAGATHTSTHQALRAREHSRTPWGFGGGWVHAQQGLLCLS